MTGLIAARLQAPGPKRILALDGGGTRGMITLAFLAEIQAKLRAQHDNPKLVLSDYFDLIGGTSVGALIGTMLALGKDVTYVRDRFEEGVPKIFGRSLASRAADYIPGSKKVRNILAPSFHAGPLRDFIDREIGSDTLVGSDKLKTCVAIVCKRADSGSVWILTNNPGHRYYPPRPNPPGSNKPTRLGNSEYKLAEVLRATTAAPGTFSSQTIHIFEGPGEYVDAKGRFVDEDGRSKKGLFVDGAVSPHNNPALLMFMMAGISGYNMGGGPREKPKPWALGANQLLLVSVGTGSFETEAKAGWTVLEDAIQGLTGMIYDGQELGLTLLQWMSDPAEPPPGANPAPHAADPSKPPFTAHWHIDRMVRDLSDDRLGESLGLSQGLLTFRRYDAPLKNDWLKTDLNRPFSAERLDQLRDFVNTKDLKVLWQIGAAAAKMQVHAHHFPGDFRLAKA